MKTLFLFLVLFQLGTALAAQDIKKMSALQLDEYIRNSDHPLLVNFWATYCKPCVAEIPYFQEEVKKYKDLELLLVSLDLPDYYPARIASFAKRMNFTASIIWLNETNADYFCPLIDKSWSGGIPSSLLVNNKKAYKKFFERQLTQAQVRENCKTLVAN
jgi:thiol-disulfide isomerase/thioredoxin